MSETWNWSSGSEVAGQLSPLRCSHIPETVGQVGQLFAMMATPEQRDRLREELGEPDRKANHGGITAEFLIPWFGRIVCRKESESDPDWIVYGVSRFGRDIAPIVRTPKKLDQITEGFWWARDKRDGKMTIIEVDTRNARHDLEPDDDDYGLLYGVVMGRDYEDKLEDGTCGILRYYDFISKIEEPA